MRIFVAPANIHTIEAFMNRVGYQGVVDKVSAFFTNNLAQPWQTMECLSSRNADSECFLKPVEIRETDDFKEYETVFMKVLRLLYQGNKIDLGSPKGKSRSVSNDDETEKEKEVAQDMNEKETEEVGIEHNIVEKEVEDYTISKTNEMLKKEMPCLVQLAVNKDREVSLVDISGMLSKEFAAHGPKLIEELFRKHMQNTTLNLYPKTRSSTATTSSTDLQQQLYLNMKTKPQDQATDPEIWEIWKAKFSWKTALALSCVQIGYERTGFTIETVTIKYDWKPPRCDLCKIFGHVHDHCPKKVSIPITVVTPVVPTPIVKMTNDGFQTVGKKKEKGKSKSINDGQIGGHSVKQNVRCEPKATTRAPKKGAANLGNLSKSSSMKNQPPKATITSIKEGKITMPNSYAALEDESDEDVENVYDESANLFRSKTGESSSTFTTAAG
ncbi:hypothetical protein Tco_0598574 [Tanacetum coccineum]